MAQEVAGVAGEKSVMEREIDTGQEHEQRSDAVDVCGGVVGEGSVPCGEAAGRKGGECVVEGVEPVHRGMHPEK